jgi:Protein of unknown function (DUF3667)
MSADREVVAAASGESPVTPIPAGAAPAGLEAPPVSAQHSPACTNCGATVSGHYCANCGQRVEHAVHSLRHFLSEVAEDLTHADSRLWRTLTALVFKPGFLTCEFLAGRRVRYLPPFRLYLVMSVFFFLVVALGSTMTNTQHASIVQIRDQATTEEDKEDLKALSDHVPLLLTDSSREEREKACNAFQYGGPWRERIEPTLRTSCVNVVKDDGHALREGFMHNLPRAIFLLLPILALVMKPLYRKPPRYFVEHLLFLLHNHAFAFLALGLLAAGRALIPFKAVTGTLALGVNLYIPYYYYRGMRRVYGEGVARTVGKLAVLSFGYAVTAGFVLVATAIYSVLVLEPV